MLERKRLDLRHVLDVHFGRKGFGYLDLRERPINLYSVLSSYWKTKYGKNGTQGSLQMCLKLRIWFLIKSNVSFAISLF